VGRSHLKWQGIDGVLVFKRLQNNRPGQVSEIIGTFVGSITILPFLKKKNFGYFFFLDLWFWLLSRRAVLTCRINRIE